MDKYTLIVAEKPDAAQRIAEALDLRGKPEKAETNHVPYFLATRDRPLVIISALGHLYTVAHEDGKRSQYPVFDLKWTPRHLVEKNAKHVKTWIEVISKLAEGADQFIDACDYDTEGALIGYTILKFACGNAEKTATRMKYSTLTKDELEKSYAERMTHLDFGMIEAGRARHEVDWLYGINLSRALTNAANRQNRGYNTISTGRVQGPTLKFLVTRERSIQTFVPTPYWSILAEIDINGTKYNVDYQQKIINKKTDADTVVQACEGKTGTIENIEQKTTQIQPPFPFDLGSLQNEAYSLFGYTPRQTGDIAERLYLDALISYPRTSSQKLPPAINCKAILKGLSHESAYQRHATQLLAKNRLRPREGPKQDPAHPAIHPTGNRPQRPLTQAEHRIRDLIIRRFMAVFGEPAIKHSMKADINVNQHHFYLRGSEVLKEGWMTCYRPYVHIEQALLPPLKEGQTVQLSKVQREDRFTGPPPRYNPSSLLKLMEKEGIGTKATRADTIETLYTRKYITDQQIAATDLGCGVTEVLHTYAPAVISVKLTRDLEEKMEHIQNGAEKRENILQEAVERLKPVLTKLKNNESAIGEALSGALKQISIQERTIGPCPTCHSGKLMILHSKRTRKRFIGCTNYFQNTCRTSFPLPQQGIVKPIGRLCRSCGWPLLCVHISGRRPWNLCFNPTCPKNQARRKHAEMHDLPTRSTVTGSEQVL